MALGDSLKAKSKKRSSESAARARFKQLSMPYEDKQEKE